MLVIFTGTDAIRLAGPQRSGVVSVSEVPVAIDASPDVRAATLAEALKAGGFAGAQAVLALASSECLCATIGTADLPTRQRRQAMLYRFEEKLPVAAEDVAADFVENRSSALAVGVERRLVDPLIDAIRQAGGRHDAVVPASLLALRNLRELRPPAGVGEQWICWRGAPGSVELFRVNRDAPTAWYVTSDEPQEIAMYLRGAGAGGGGATPVVLTCGMPAASVESLRSTGISIETFDAPPMQDAAVSGAMALLRRKAPAWVGLSNCGPANRVGTTRLRAVAVAASVFFGCLAAALFARAARYERLAGRYESEQQELFRRLFPGSPVPIDVRSRLASEARARGDGANGGGAARDENGLLVLRDVLSHLPGETRFRISEIRLEDRAFTLEGEVPSHGDAEAVAVALRRRSGFDIDPPRTEQRGPAVGFTINGSAGKHSGVGDDEQRASR
jgi:hypothetical protein